MIDKLEVLAKRLRGPNPRHLCGEAADALEEAQRRIRELEQEVSSRRRYYFDDRRKFKAISRGFRS